VRKERTDYRSLKNQLIRVQQNLRFTWGRSSKLKGGPLVVKPPAQHKKIFGRNGGMRQNEKVWSRSTIEEPVACARQK